MKLKPLDSVEGTNAPASSRTQGQHPTYEDRDVSPESARLFPAMPSAREPYESAPVLIGERAHRFHFLPLSSIDYLQVDGNYVTMHVGEDRYLARATLKHLSDVLAAFDFMRIDRSVLINLQQVEYIERLDGGRFAFQLRRGHYLVSNRERRGAISRLLRSAIH